MFNFQIEASSKSDLYAQLIEAADAITLGEPDAIANMANVSALLFDALPDLNWAGFYRNIGGELVLGPFQGKAACLRIPFGKGVCGAAAATRQVQLVEDVHAFPGHIACDAASRSELVVPVVDAGELIGVLDLDSPSVARFDSEDAAGCAELIQVIAGRLGEMASRAAAR
jgi:GAF domain-containing protein